MLPYDEAGSGDSVVLIHAGVGDRRMWRELLPRLAEAGFHALAVDLPGFGDASVANGPQAPWEDVLLTLRELGIDRAVLVGNSFGAAVALRMAAVAPEVASGLVLVSAPPVDIDPSPVLLAAWEAEESALERGDIDAAVAAVVDAWIQPQAPEELREFVASMQRRALELQAAGDELPEAPDPLEQHPEILAELRIPALVAAGEHDMPDFIAGAEQFAGTLPLARHTLISGAGHLAPLEAPELFEQLLVGFLHDTATP